jgi:sortase (surface protein transpeptidase)
MTDSPSRPTAPAARTRRAVLVAAALAVLLTGCSVAAPTAAPEPAPATSAPAPTATPAPEASAAPAAPLTEGRPPTRLEIPALGLDQELIELGIDDDGAMEVPFDFSDVGWFTGGGMPGGIGPTVLAGHVDSFRGPAVFFELHELVAGDTVSVTDVDGAVVTYEVYRSEEFTKAGFPTAEVFGSIPADELRLITCSGFFDEDARDYDSNRVVFAKPVG